VVRFAAAMATGKRKTAAQRPTLENLARHDPSGSVRVGALYALHRLGDPIDWRTLTEALRSPDESTRANTALVMGLMGDRAAIPLLEAARTEKEPPVNFEISAALARLGDEHGQQYITARALSLFADDEWAALTVCADLPREVAADPLLLGLQGVPDNVPADKREIAKQLTARRQLVAARGLAKMHSAQGAQVAIDNLQSSDPDLRALAALAVGEMLAPQQDHFLAGLMDDSQPPEVQRAAAAAVVNIWARSGM
jgi:HEAT repeat protein